MTHSFDNNIQQLQRQFLDGLPQKAHQLEDLWRHLRFLNWTEQGFKTFQQLVHRLVGAGASFGLPLVSETAQYLDTYLIEHQELGQLLGGIELEMIDQMVSTLAHTLTHLQSSDTLPESQVANTVGEGKHIFVVEADHAMSALLSAYLHAAGFSVEHFDTPTACSQQLNLQTPHAIIIDPGINGDASLAFDAILQIKTRLADVPIIFLSARSDMNTRLRALRAGCASFVTKPIDFSSLVKNLVHIIDANEVSYKVMIVDDEELVARYHAEILRHSGMEVICVSQPMQSLRRAREFKPDLVILDMHMPNINGIELATLLRQDEQFLLLPIIFVTADTSTKLRNSIETIGVNAVLTKPVDVGVLASAAERAINDTFTLKNRIESITRRARHNNQITRSYFFTAIDNELQEDHSHKTPTALYYLGLDVDESFYQHYGKAGIANLHEQFCQQVAQIIGSEEQWTDVANFAACILVGKRTHKLHQHRAEQIANQLASVVYTSNNQELVIAAHVGIHYLDTETGSASSAVTHAEQAYELAKTPITAGQNESIPTLHIETPDISIEFTERLPEENLRISYQPMISLEQHNIEHFEALVRWRVNDDELIPAAKFLHYIQHSSMRVDLDRWVLQSAVSAITNDTYARENATLFVHLADETLNQKSFFSFASNVLRSSRLRGQHRLIFIFEELWVVLHTEETLSIINSLHNIQCGACLSHAGATHRTEGLLEKIDFDYVRLAPALTSNLGNHPDQEKRLTSIIEAAKIHATQIIATQVEDSKNLSTLWIQGIRLFQGFLLQSPDQSIKNYNDMDLIKQFFNTGEAK